MGDLRDIETWGMTARPSHVSLASAARVRAQCKIIFHSTRVLQCDFNNLELLKLLRAHDLILSTLSKLRLETSPEPLQAWLPEPPGLLPPSKVPKNIAI
jgi:hypothetical protein